MELLPKEFTQELKYKIIKEGTYNDEGDYIVGEEKEIILEGCVLPLNERDMQFLSDGSYSINDMKLYTTEDLKDNTIVEDVEGEKYKIYAHKKYNKISKMKRYFMKGIDKING